MLLFKKVIELQNFLASQAKSNKSIGFAPTMGALHEGHLSLVSISKAQNDITVVSIFVNPTQFNDKNDLIKYPKPIENDIALLSKAGCDVLFLPDVNEIYPNGLDTTINVDIGNLEKVLEGEFRPGHFNGMMQVVNRLLNIVMPDKLFMGQKDFQQFTIVRTMLKTLKSNIELIVCPTLRENDGLAMSSRNVRLTPENREKAGILYQCLTFAQENIHSLSVIEIKEHCKEVLKSSSDKFEYFDIVDGNTLESVVKIDKNIEVVALVATWFGDVRLIDNMILQYSVK
jgi:pantoate--beta-alanine ligase